MAEDITDEQISKNLFVNCYWFLKKIDEDEEKKSEKKEK
jgi:hypothetical protein